MVGLCCFHPALPLIFVVSALPLGPRSTIPNAPKGPKASRHRDALPEAQKAGLDYGGEPEAKPSTGAASNDGADNAPTRAPLPSRQELTRAHTPSESEDDGRRSKHVSPKRESRRNSPKEQDQNRDAEEPMEGPHSGRDSEGDHSDTRTDDRTKSSTTVRRSTRETRDSGSRSAQHRDSKTSGERTRGDRYRSSRDDRSGKDDRSRGSRRSSRSPTRRRDDDRDKDRKSSSRHHRTRSDKDGSVVDEEEEVKKEPRRSTRNEAEKS